MEGSSASDERLLREAGLGHNTGSSNTGEDEDFAIAKALQEQERAFMALQRFMHGDTREFRRAAHGRAEAESEEGPDDADDKEGSADLSGEGCEEEDGDDEAFARRLQEEADREHYARLIELTGGHSDLEAAFRGAGIAEGEEGDDDWTGEEEDQDYLTEDSIDPDDMTYEELQALGEAVGIVSRGVPKALIDALPRIKYTSRFPPGGARSEEEEEEQCAVCRMEFEPEEEVVALPCKHLYHGECISQWLKDRKACPICGRELLPEAKQAERSRDAVMEQSGTK
ncbi:hypothetical protein CVIRNUC_004697 [Coccomyxa viridis]|uniref:RING-type domain-containing protein n=1 Tax=Coccomyxa viridis TaxID=1274662 RepID=A0AAV1I442_9CHLO|nr:hypothetical protein CVIRNUC_004697 [Coccomyxa viridis]